MGTFNDILLVCLFWYVLAAVYAAWKIHFLSKENKELSETNERLSVGNKLLISEKEELRAINAKLKNELTDDGVETGACFVCKNGIQEKDRFGNLIRATCALKIKCKQFEGINSDGK